MDKNENNFEFDGDNISETNTNNNFDTSSKFPKEELREIEQYFFTEYVIQNIVEALSFENEIICLGTPAIADGFWRIKNREVICLDIDKRFSYLPGYKYYDILSECKDNDNDSNSDSLTSNSSLNIPKPSVIVIDPPFFKLSLVDLFNCVEKLTNKDRNTKIVFAFVQREERSLLNIFKPYNLKLTKFKLEYRYVDRTKWANYGLYSNYEFNKIKFLHKAKAIDKHKNTNTNKSNKLKK